MVPVCLLLHGQARGDCEAERVAVRPVRVWDAWAMAGLVLPAGAAGAVTAWAGHPVDVPIARNLAGYLGLALLARWVAGPGAAHVVVALFPFACASFGVRPTGRPEPWARPFHAPGSVPALVLAVAPLAAGLVVARRDPLAVRREGTVADGG
ncbi:hypothetical protein ACLGI4_16255 [Streptomyces sp. HMX112]|uniref:hypothetical protein n=1 Tax=Streptomyces sp. HMX112 TaxID=3390850 RepID=UPI003A80CD4F